METAPPTRQINATEREAVQTALQMLSIGEGRAYEHLSAMFRWLLATLFTANGGAILALLSRSDGAKGAVYIFTLGMVLSLIMGVASTLGAIRISSRLNNARVIAQLMLLDGVDRGVDLQARLNEFKTTWRSWLPGYIGGASLLCLIVGMLLTAG